MGLTVGATLLGPDPGGGRGGREEWGSGEGWAGTQTLGLIPELRRTDPRAKRPKGQSVLSPHYSGTLAGLGRIKGPLPLDPGSLEC